MDMRCSTYLSWCITTDKGDAHMRVKINRDVCSAQLAFCERRLGKFLRYPIGYERHCIRTALEDKTLHEELSGYREYAQQTRYRLIPGVW
jgi:hypothetical protein